MKKNAVRYGSVVLAFMLATTWAGAAIILDHEGSNNPATEVPGFGPLQANTVNGYTATVSPVTGDLGYNAWQINTMANQSLYAYYQASLTSQAVSLYTNGWRLTVVARVVQTFTPGSGNGGAYLSLYIDGKRYNLGLNLDSTGTPTNTQVWTNSGTIHNLPGGSIYHTCVLYSPAQSVNPNLYASLYIDGNLVEQNIKTISSGSLLYFGDASGNDGQITNTNWSVVKLESPSPPMPAGLTGTIIPGGYLGDKQDLALKVDFRQGGTSVLISRVMLNSAGQFTVSNVPSGIYDLYFEIGGWLQKVLTSQSLVADPTNIGTVTLVNGDCDSDNEVTSTDLSIVLANMDQPGDP